MASHHSEVPLEELYEVPQNEGDGEVLYDNPSEGDAAVYTLVSHNQTNKSTTSPEIYTKFDNPLYGEN